jgi:hypothetical protein
MSEEAKALYDFICNNGPRSTSGDNATSVAIKRLAMAMCEIAVRIGQPR